MNHKKNVDKGQAKQDKVALLEQEVMPAIEEVKEIEVIDEKSLRDATIILSQLNRTLDRAGAEKERITKPANEILKAERSRWKPLETSLEASIESIRTKMSIYQTMALKRSQEKIDVIGSKLASGGLSLTAALKKVNSVDKPVDSVDTLAGSLSFKAKQTLKIVAFDLIPDLYWTIDESFLLEALKAGKIIPGATIEVIQVPVNRR